MASLRLRAALPRPAAVLAALGAACVLAAPAVPARAGDPAPGSEVFFREPDEATRKRIQDLIGQCVSDAVLTRRRARADLAALGYWSVDPLVAAVKDREPQAKCAAILVLDAIRDRRALGPLRDSVVREESNVYVGAFAALALGRFSDAEAVEPFRKALANPRVLEMLHASVPFALARVRTPEASAMLTALVTEPDAAEPVQSARLLALGFFPEVALANDGSTPGPLLAAGLKSGRRGEQQAALLAFCAATSRGRRGKEFLAKTADADPVPQVLSVALVGLALYSDSDVTERFARTAASGAPDEVRELACDLLVPRADPVALPSLLQILRTAASSRLRASAVMALGPLTADEAQEAVLGALRDRTPLVRAAAAVAACGSASGPLRQESFRRIDARLASGEPDKNVRGLFQLARSVLSGERRDVVWPEVAPGNLFASVAQPPRRRLLRAINRRVELSLDLGKLNNLQTDAALTAGDAPGGIGDLDPRDGPIGGVPTEENPRGGPNPGGVPAPSVGAVGAARTSSWQELRDLAEELAWRPYFTEADLPTPPAAATGAEPRPEPAVPPGAPVK